MSKIYNNKTSRFRFNPSRFGFAIIMLSMLPACGSRPGLDTADAEIPLDAEILQDAGPADAVIPMPCGENSGLQPGSPWPMHMGCPERRNRSAAIGPAAPDKIRYFEGNDIYRIGDDPVIGADGTVYIGSFYPHFGEGSNFDPEYCVRRLHAFNPDGTEQWVFEATADFEEGDEYYPGFGDPPRSIILAEDRIYFTHGNDCGTGGGYYPKPSVMAVDYEGNEIWNFPVRDITNSITVDPDGSLYFLDIRKYSVNNVNHLVSLTPDGSERWASPIVGSAGYMYPLLYAEGRIFVGSQGIVFSFNSDHGDLAWEMEIGDYLTSAMSLGDNGIIYLTASVNKMDSLFALSPEGEILWSQPIGEGSSMSSLAVGPDGMILGSIENNIFAFASEGDLLWTYELGRNYVGPVIDGEGTIYANMKGTINAISHDGSLKWTTKETGLDFDSFATPAIGADGALYISCRSKLCVIEP